MYDADNYNEVAESVPKVTVLHIPIEYDNYPHPSYYQSSDSIFSPYQF